MAANTAERFHMWAPRPLLRSILWTPRGADAALVAGAPYDVFITQRALADLLDHVRSGADEGRPFGLLAGDLCEDSDGERRYVLVRGICRSRIPLASGDGDLIPATAWESLRGAAEGRQGSLVGWYLSRPTGALALSEPEIAAHRRYFNEPWHSAIVVCPDRNEPRGAFFRRTDTGVSGAEPLPFYEVVSADAMSGGKKLTFIDWIDAEADAPVKRADPNGGAKQDGQDPEVGIPHLAESASFLRAKMAEYGMA